MESDRTWIGDGNLSGVYEDSTDEWSTPPGVVRPIYEAVGGFDLDPASGAEKSPHAKTTFEKSEDGLVKPWFGDVWLNPPYSDIGPWLSKSVSEVNQGDADLVVALVPDRLQTAWFQDHAPESSSMCIIRGCISFGNADDTAPFGSVLVTFGEVNDDLLRLFNNMGFTLTNKSHHNETSKSVLSDYV